MPNTEIWPEIYTGLICLVCIYCTKARLVLQEKFGKRMMYSYIFLKKPTRHAATVTAKARPSLSTHARSAP